MKFKLLGLLALVSVLLHAQDPAAKKYGEQITIGDLKDHLSIIASDALEGRETGTRGQKMAAAYISAHFEEIGLTAPVKGNYYQPVPLYTSELGEAYVKVGKTILDSNKDVAYYGSGHTDSEVSLPLVFIGNATEEDLAQVDIKDKAVLMFAEGRRLFGNSTLNTVREKGAKLLLVCNTKTQGEFDELASQIKRFTSGGRLSLSKPTSDEQYGIFLVSPAATEKLMNTSMDKLSKATADTKKSSLKKFKPSSIQFKITQHVRTVMTENVLGYLEGTDKKDEVIIVTAHYDHIGKRSGGTGDQINNGADDDGSGTVAVLEMAQSFSQAKKDGQGPRRSILFMTVTGEEKGLLGSAYYSENPVFPLANTVVDLNIDMIGRSDPQHKDSDPYVYVIGSDKLSLELHQVSEDINKKTTNLVFDYTYNDENHPDRLYYRSDHWNFARKNIPIIFYFDGIHEDYHKVSDEVDKIEFDLLEKRTRCVFYTAWELANRDKRIMPDPDKIKK